ncbi:HIT family protein [Enterococcus alcedinis]|uniref:DeoR family transcriptional regulator n=1 Tax=Enterococcus alcedinis TaxID=1274384 RepID=A0A917N5G1_9ENTE|nr:HIT domain-containing protein [Enterococcus alcedinis]MBP2102716.1 diadenosine tetraphosphate (Ap4A) HIT family hydrolase [Enterococcus alcedinis]GGI66276.1 DeoR family transcriptional regulator [Enterococcus alcedinis]
MSWRNNRIKAAIEGKNPMLIKELSGSYVVFGDVQFLPGYCVLLPKREVFSLNDLTMEERSAFLVDMSVVGDAILASTDAIRMNYDILGNTDAYLHAHVFPRYDWEEEQRKKMPVWLYDSSNWSNVETAYAEEKHGELRQKIADYLLNPSKE